MMIIGLFIVSTSALVSSSSFAAAVDDVDSSAYSKCEADWTAFNGSCFKVYISKVVMLEARRKCVLDYGADLASVHSREEDLFVRDLTNEASTSALLANQTTTAFYTGLMLTWIIANLSRTDKLMDVQWMDGSPVDYGNPMAPGFQRGQQPWHNGRLADSKWAQTPQRPEEPNNQGNRDAIEHCVLMLNEQRGNGDWADFACDAPQPYVCRKNPNRSNAFSFPTEFTSFATPAMSLLAIFSQIYVLWLIATKSPAGIKDYSFFLTANTLFDMLFTFVLGILFNPDLWIPFVVAGSVNGLARYLGTYGGNISICLTVLACAGQVHFEMFSLLFRFASVMEREYPKLLLRINRRKTRVFLIVIALIVSLGLALVTLSTLDIVEKISLYIIHHNGGGAKAYSDATLAGLPVFMVNNQMIHWDVFVFALLFFCIQLSCLCMCVRILLYLRANAKYFTKRTYQLQMQLIMSLTAQLFLPFLLVGIPLLAAFIAKLHDYMPAKASVDLGILMLELYALGNPLMVVLFVTAYRRFTFRLLGIEALRRRFLLGSTAGTSAEQNKQHGQQQQQLQQGQQQQQQFVTTVVETIPLPVVVG